MQKTPIHACLPILSPCNPPCAPVAPPSPSRSCLSASPRPCPCPCLLRLCLKPGGRSPPSLCLSWESPLSLGAGSLVLPPAHSSAVPEVPWGGIVWGSGEMWGAGGLEVSGAGQCLGQRVWGESREGTQRRGSSRGDTEGTWRREAWAWGQEGRPRVGGREPFGSAIPLSQPLPKCRQSLPKAPSEPPPLQPHGPKGRQGAWAGGGTVLGWPVCWDPSDPHRYGVNSHRALLLALLGVGEHGWVCATKIPPSWAKSCPWESRGGEMHGRHDGFLMPDECWPCKRSYTGASLISPKSSPEASGHRPGSLSVYPKFSPVPPHWPRSLVHTKPCPWLPVAMASTNAPSLPQFPHLENGYSRTHPTL